MEFILQIPVELNPLTCGSKLLRGAMEKFLHGVTKSFDNSSEITVYSLQWK